MKDTLGKEFYESADKTITITKQETLEEAAENYNLNTINAFGDYESFIAGAKWQQERSYSEEDMINFVEFVSKYYSDDLMENSTIYELLEQFKNK